MADLRITRLGFRKGDGAEMALVELVGSELKEKTPEKKKRREKKEEPSKETPQEK